MARVAQGYKVRWRRGRAFVRFTHEGVRTEQSLRATDPREAQKEARIRYAETIAGRTLATSPRASILDLVAKWIEARRPALRPPTLAMYEAHSIPFIAFFRTLDRITPARIEEFAESLIAQCLVGTARLRLGVLSSFLGWCKKRGLISQRPQMPRYEPSAEGTPSKKRKRREITILDAEHVEKILAAMPERNLRGKVVRARFAFAYETGLRPALLSKLEAPTHYRKGDRRLRISKEIDKIGFARAVALSDAAFEAIDSCCPDVGKIFGHIASYNAFRLAVSKAGLPAHIADHAAPYDLRHSRITRWLEETGQLLGTAQLVGHLHPTTTDRYTHMREEMGARVISGAKMGAVSEAVRKTGGKS